MFLLVVVVVGFRFVVRKEFFVHLLICNVIELCSLLADHSARVARIGVGSTAPSSLFGVVSLFQRCPNVCKGLPRRG